MELLVGVIHEQKSFRKVSNYISRTCPHMDSLMLEMPSNWPRIEELYPGEYKIEFFSSLERIYKKKGVRIVCGDVPMRKVRRLEGWDDFEESYFERFRGKNAEERRDKFMALTIKKENPDVVVVGREHAEYIRSLFPKVNCKLY